MTRPQIVCGLFVLWPTSFSLLAFSQERKDAVRGGVLPLKAGLDIGAENLPVDQVAQGVDDQQVQFLRAGG